MADPALMLAVGGELDRIRAQAERTMAALWDQLPGTPRELLGQWIDLATPIVDAATERAVSVTDAYLAAALDDAPIGITATEATAALRNGVATEQILERPFLRTWHHLAQGATYGQAFAAGRTFAASIGSGTVTRGHFGAMHASMASRPWVQGYRRAVNAGACDFCILVAGNVYSRADIAKVHRGCGCIAEPIPGREYVARRPGTAARNVGQVVDRNGRPIDQARLDDIRERSRQRTATGAGRDRAPARVPVPA